MLIQTKIFFRDPDTEDVVGGKVQEFDEFIVDLREVSGITPYDGGKATCLFLNGRDITITEGYDHVKFLWSKCKGLKIELL